MATIQKFEDLVCWQKARELANFVYGATDDPRFTDMVLKNHMRKTSISPMSNIAEGFDRGTRSEFVDALFIAKGEVGEMKSQLYLAGDRGYIEISKCRNGLALCDECSRLIQSFIYRLKTGGQTGLQYKREKTKAQLEGEKFDIETLEQLRDSNPENFEKYFKEKYERLKRGL